MYTFNFILSGRAIYRLNEKKKKTVRVFEKSTRRKTNQSSFANIFVSTDVSIATFSVYGVRSLNLQLFLLTWKPFPLHHWFSHPGRESFIVRRKRKSSSETHGRFILIMNQQKSHLIFTSFWAMFNCVNKRNQIRVSNNKS